MSTSGIYGLSGSGMDIDSMVKTAMKAKQSQYDKMYKKETKQAWQKAAYNDFYTSMTTFKYSTLSNYKMQSTMSAMSATSSDSKVATVTANGEAAAMSHKITVNSLATNAYLQTTSAGIKRDNTAGAKTSIYLKDIMQASILSPTAAAGATAGIASYDATADVMTFNDGTTLASASTVAALSFNIKDSATTTTTTGYTTTTKDGSGNAVSGFIPSAAASTYTDGNGIVYDTASVDNGAAGIVTTLTPQGGGAALTYTTKTVDSQTGIAKDGFYPAQVGSTVQTSGATTTTTTTTVASDGSISTSITANAPSAGKPLVYTYKDLYEKTLNDLTLDISNANSNVTASYDAVNDSISIYNKNGGSKNLLSISAFTGAYTKDDGKEAQGATSTAMANALFNNLSLGMYDGTTLNPAQTMADGTPLSAVGTSGSVTIDGKIYGDLTSNKVTAAGVSYSLLAKGNSTVVTSQDTDTIIKNVKQFVTDYNKMLDSLNDKIYETNYKSGAKSSVNYDPLTDAEKKDMSDDEVAAWEKKAKTGLLYQSSVLRNIVTTMRSALSTPVESVDSKYNTLSSIGITSSTNKGHIELNEEKLKKAMAADPDCVYQLFASGATSTSTTPDTANDGVAVRLDTVMKTALSSIATEAGTTAASTDQSNLGKLITAMQGKMDDFQEMMDDYQSKLYKKYDAMEAAIAKLNSQTSYISQAFSG